jgi:hypothetical protein
MMPRPQNKQETKTLELSVPIALYEYLGHLATHTQLGPSENAIALLLLTQALVGLQREKFHELPLPRVREPTSTST